ncbi:MAG: RNA polymerase subunit sigma-24 [Chlorobiaceae bacterium]
MNRIKKTPLDLLDDIYNLAWWMTGSENASCELVTKTYLSASTQTRETELIKSFRKSYVDLFGQKAEFSSAEKSRCSDRNLMESLKNRAADIKLSVLLCEISGLSHRQISEVVDKPVETVRLWLYWGRKLLADDCLLKASA